MKTRLSTAAVLGTVIIAAPGNASTEHTGGMSFGEWAIITKGQTQTYTEGPEFCLCNGHTIRKWNRNGIQHKAVQYPNWTSGAPHAPKPVSGAVLNYERVNGQWIVSNWKGWQDEGSLVKFRFDTTGRVQIVCPTCTGGRDDG